MPAYVAQQAPVLLTNGQKSVWNAESVAANGASQAVQLERRKSSTNYPAWGFAVQVEFGSAPGSFDIEIQGSETDTDASYIKLASITAVNASNFGRGDYLSYYPKYVRLFMKTLTGTKTVTAIITH